MCVMQRMVIKTKSVEFMPFFLSLFVFLCGTSWFVFGLLGRDPFVAVSFIFLTSLLNSEEFWLFVHVLRNLMLQVPNGFGSGLGTMQLILYFIYHKKGEPKKSSATNGSVEMGQEKPSEGTKMANGNGSLVEQV